MNRRFMSFSFFWVLTAVLLFSTSAAAQNQAAVMPGPGWQVIKADWGSGNRWVDVTNRVRVLLSGNGMVQVTNSNLGGDPAQGSVKALRIQARNSRGQSRQFTFNENDSIDASQFYNYSGGTGGGNGSGLQVMQADWGSGNRRMDVTSRVRTLLSGNGMVKVNNANLGGDPAVGADKTLRIYARDMQGQVRQLSYKEGSNIDASQFYNYGGGGGYPGNPGYPGSPGIPGGGNGNLQIVRAYYGLNNRTNDVTQLLRGRVQNGTLVMQVNNNNMGGDPAVGGDKVLTVIYRYQGREQTSTVKEGNTLRIP
jgi:DnaJ-like protein C11, C-terminal